MIQPILSGDDSVGGCDRRMRSAGASNDSGGDQDDGATAAIPQPSSTRTGKMIESPAVPETIRRAPRPAEVSMPERCVKTVSSTR